MISSSIALPGGHFHSPHPYGHNGHVHDNGNYHPHNGIPVNVMLWVLGTPSLPPSDIFTLECTQVFLACTGILASTQFPQPTRRKLPAMVTITVTIMVTIVQLVHHHLRLQCSVVTMIMMDTFEEQYMLGNRLLNSPLSRALRRPQ